MDINKQIEKLKKKCDYNDYIIEPIELTTITLPGYGTQKDTLPITKSAIENSIENRNKVENIYVNTDECDQKRNNDKNDKTVKNEEGNKKKQRINKKQSIDKEDSNVKIKYFRKFSYTENDSEHSIKMSRDNLKKRLDRKSNSSEIIETNAEEQTVTSPTKNENEAKEIIYQNVKQIAKQKSEREEIVYGNIDFIAPKRDVPLEKLVSETITPFTACIHGTVDGLNSKVVTVHEKYTISKLSCWNEASKQIYLPCDVPLVMPYVPLKSTPMSLAGDVATFRKHRQFKWVINLKEFTLPYGSSVPTATIFEVTKTWSKKTLTLVIFPERIKIKVPLDTEGDFRECMCPELSRRMPLKDIDEFPILVYFPEITGDAPREVLTVSRQKLLVMESLDIDFAITTLEDERLIKAFPIEQSCTADLLRVSSESKKLTTDEIEVVHRHIDKHQPNSVVSLHLEDLLKLRSELNEENTLIEEDTTEYAATTFPPDKSLSMRSNSDFSSLKRREDNPRCYRTCSLELDSSTNDMLRDDPEAYKVFRSNFKQCFSSFGKSFDHSTVSEEGDYHIDDPHETSIDDGTYCQPELVIERANPGKEFSTPKLLRKKDQMRSPPPTPLSPSNKETHKETHYENLHVTIKMSPSSDYTARDRSHSKRIYDVPTTLPLNSPSTSESKHSSSTTDTSSDASAYLEPVGDAYVNMTEQQTHEKDHEYAFIEQT